MKLGIKVGHWKESIHDLEVTGAPFCEVWFDPNRLLEYTNLFDELKRRHIDVGLHFWGVCEDNLWANIAYPDKNLIHQSLVLMRKTIDVAAKNHFQYVNIHPGCRAKVKLFFEKEEFVIDSEPVPLEIAEPLLIEHALELSNYAKNLGVVFTVETVPVRVATNLLSKGTVARNHPKDIFELPISSILTLAQKGIWIANDFCHTAANKISDDRTEIWNFVKDTTKILAPQTKLIHVGFVVPPYNGTDFHDHLDNPLLDTDQAIPNKNELKGLLKLFKNRDDVWAIVEPANDHPKNYFLLQKLYAQI